MLVKTNAKNRMKIKSYLDDNKINWSRSFHKGQDAWNIYISDKEKEKSVIAHVRQLNESKKIQNFKDFFLTLNKK